MPTEKRNYFKINGIRAHWRKKKSGVFEIRCMINGEKYYGASVDLKIARQRFIDDLKRERPKEVAAPEKRATLVKDYALHYMETFKKPNVGADTYANYLNAVKVHIIAKIGDRPIGDITATDCQVLLKNLRAEGKGRKAEDLKNLLRWIFETAKSDRLIPNNPMDSVKIPKHRRKNGRCIPPEWMQKLLMEPENRYDYIIWFVAYTGIRPIELKSAVFEEKFFTVKNAKQKPDEDPTYRRIPIHRNLMPYIPTIKTLAQIDMKKVSYYFRTKKCVPDCRFYDLRHTFTTVIQECGANKEWVDYVTNHVAAQNVTDRVYTHWSDGFQLEQMNKLHF